MNEEPTMQGLCAALWTPLTAGGEVDFRALDELLEFLSGQPLSGYLLLGSTGRFPHLSEAQRIEFVRHVIPRAGSRPCAVNVSDLNEEVAVRMGRAARQAGAVGAAVMTPWYYQQTQCDLVEWFARIGERVELPLWLYNYPEATGNRIELHTIESVAARVPVAAYKHSGSDFEFIRPLARLGQRLGFTVFAGTNTRLREARGLGAGGVISGLICPAPDVMHAVYHPTVDPKFHAEGCLTALGRCLALAPFPFNVAAVMAGRGLPFGALPDWWSRTTHAHFAQLKQEAAQAFDTHGFSRGQPGVTPRPGKTVAQG